jgi:hypothetical protein
MADEKNEKGWEMFILISCKEMIGNEIREVQEERNER